MSNITIDDFSKVEIKIGTVVSAEKVPDADRLLKLIFDFGPLLVIPSAVEGSHEEISPRASLGRNDNEENPSTSSGTKYISELLEQYPGRDVRQIMSAIAPFYPDPSVLVGKQIPVVVNLEPRTFRGYESQGMIMATDNEEGIVLLVPEKPVKAGARIH